MNTATPERLATTTPSGGGLSGAIASEWTKLWSVRSTAWNLLTTVVLMVVVSTQVGIDLAGSNTDADRAYDAGIVALTEPAVSAITLVQYVVLALAMLVITSEYSTGSIRSTLQWVPVRRHVLLAKVVVVAPVTFGIGCALSVIGSLAAWPWLGTWGEFDTGTMAADTLRIGTYLALVSLFTLGLGTLIRNAVGTLTTVFIVLAVLPGLLGSSMLLPAGAGQAFLTGIPDPWSPLAGLVVLAFWSAVSLLAGAWVLRSRDA